jgi:ribonuclease-3
MDLASLEKKLNYKFINQALLVQALTHKSKTVDNNERLEFVGDSLLNTIIAIELFTKFKVDEGRLTRMRSSLVCGTMLAKLAQDLHLEQYIILSDSERKTGGHHRSSILADAFEAILASIFLDSGRDFTNIYSIVVKIFEPHINNNLLEQGAKDPKTTLQEICQAKNRQLPIYTVESALGQEHNRQFSVSCILEDFNVKTIGTGTSRRKAEQMAAMRAIEEIK